MPPSADSSSPRFCARASVKAPRSWPNSSLSRIVLGQRRAGDVHERPRRAIARVVQHLRREILAGAALARQQHRRRRAAPPLSAAAPSRPQSARLLADDAIDAVRLRLARAQRAHFAAQPRRFERLLHEQRDFVEVERLVRVVIRAVLHRLDRRVDGRIRGQQNDERVGVRFLDLLEHRQAVAVRQLVIEQDEIDAFGVTLDRRPRRVGLDDAIAFARETVVQRPANQLLVVHDEHRRRQHGMGSSIRAASEHVPRWRPAGRARRA